MSKPFIWLLFFLSGTCALIYEVLWMRHLGLILGNTVHSLAAVLSAFMGGLALGSYLAGRFLAKRRRLLLLYGGLEILIGLYCLLLPWLFEATIPLYASLYDEGAGGLALPVARFVICFILLIIPTTCMGATLPILTQHLIKEPSGLSRTAGTLYAINTFGAVLGAASAGFYLLPALGRTWSNNVAVISNLLLGLLAVGFGMRKSSASSATDTEARSMDPELGRQALTDSCADASSEQPAQPGSDLAVRAAAMAFGVTGFAAMVTQIGWTRALSLSLGSSTYAFSLIVSIFILGLALGGAWGARVAHRLKDPVATLSQVLMLIGILAMVLVSMLGWAPLVFFWLIAVGSQWGFASLMWIEALGIGVLLLLPTFLMGTIMPITLQIARNGASGRGGAGRTVGSLYSINTVGSILGSLMGGLVLLPFLQIQATLKISALLYTFPGLALFRLAVGFENRRQQLWSGVLVTGAFLLAFLPTWDPLKMSAGAYLLRDPSAREAARRGAFFQANPFPSDTQILYYREGASATVTVTESADKNLTLSIGGKPDASSADDMTTQIGLSLIPELLHEKGPEDVLVIGMGSGVSVGAGLAVESVKHVDVLEISPEVMEAAWFFRRHSELKFEDPERPSPLAEPKVRVVINDGRNHLRLTERTYDVISSEPSNPWIAGIGNLFTKEAFWLCRSRLNPGGIMCQWLHSYGMAEQEVRSVFRTFAEVFPHTQLWCVLPGSDYLLLGSQSPIRIDLLKLGERARTPRVEDILKKVNFHILPELLACFMADTAQVRALGDQAPIHTDDNMRLEFAAPRTMYEGHVQFPVLGWRVPIDRVLAETKMKKDERREFVSYLDRALVGRMCYETRKDGFGPPRLLVESALLFAPYQIWALRESMQMAREQNQKPLLPADLDLAIQFLKAGGAPNIKKEVLDQHLSMALMARARRHLRKGRTADAGSDIREAESLATGRYEMDLLRASLLATQGKIDESLAMAEQAQTSGASSIQVAEVAVRALLSGNRLADAQLNLDQILGMLKARSDPDTALLWAMKAEFLFLKGHRDGAFHTMVHAGKLGGPDLEVQIAKARFMIEFGGLPGLQEAVKAQELIVGLTPNDPDAYIAQVDYEWRLARLYGGLKEETKSLDHMWRARRAAHAARALNMQDPTPCIWGARVFLALQDSDSAKVALIQAIKLGGQDFQVPEDLKGLVPADATADKEKELAPAP